MKRTYIATGNILHGVAGKNTLYLPGDTITFGEETPDEQIQALLDAGNLGGPQAAKVAQERAIEFAKTGIAAMSDEQLVALWQRATKQSPAQLALAEKRAARQKEDAEGARRANIDEGLAEEKAATEPEQPEDEPPATANDDESSATVRRAPISYRRATQKD